MTVEEMTVEKIALRLEKKYPSTLPGFEDIVLRSLDTRAKKIFRYLKERADRHTEKCGSCLERYGKKSLAVEVYDSPFDDTGYDIHFCSEDCRENVSSGSFGYFLCDGCQRYVCWRNPSNGWHEHFRYMEDEIICLRCYEEHILKHGIDREEFESGYIAGMFFSRDNQEVLDAGYTIVEGYQDTFVGSRQQAREYCAKAIELIDRGYQVVNAYERMGIGGSEGTVSMYAKSKPVVSIKNSWIGKDGRLRGILGSDHPRGIKKGEFVTTSTVVKITVETKNTIYVITDKKIRENM